MGVPVVTKMLAVGDVLEKVKDGSKVFTPICAMVVCCTVEDAVNVSVSVPGTAIVVVEPPEELKTAVTPDGRLNTLIVALP